MVVTLPIATIKRILDRESSLPEQASEFILGEALARIRIRDAVEMNSPTQTTKPLPKLSKNIVSALEKARDDKTLIDGSKHVGHLRRDDFTTLRDWCRAMRLGSTRPQWKPLLRLCRNEPPPQGGAGAVGETAEG